ncbi:MAG: glycerate kinase, partial [Actinobacteria bacterium]|nr:glycerate kinase [Actinomycetota bacterium]
RLLESADLVIVGEGRLDSQSLAGKAPIAAARLAKAKGVPVLAFAGSIELTEEELRAEGIGSSAAIEDVAKTEAESAPGAALAALVARKIAQLGPVR